MNRRPRHSTPRAAVADSAHFAVKPPDSCTEPHLPPKIKLRRSPRSPAWRRSESCAPVRIFMVFLKPSACNKAYHLVNILNNLNKQRNKRADEGCGYHERQDSYRAYRAMGQIYKNTSSLNLDQGGWTSDRRADNHGKYFL